MAGSLAITSATTKLYVSAALPATYDATGFAALTWIEVGEISSLGQYGGQTTVVTHIPISSAIVAKRGGSQNFGQMSMTLARHKGNDSDELQDAFDDRAPRAFKVALPAALGDIDYFTAICTSVQTNVGNADQILESMVTLELDDRVITVGD